MPLIFIFLIGIAVALARRRLLIAPAERAAGGDAPARLVGWAVGLLDASRGEWGQAMIGELDRLDGRARRWRFAVDCVAAALVLPPWGRAAAALAAMMAVAASAAGLALYTHIHYRLHVDGWTWAGAAVLLVVLVGYLLGGGALLRRPGVAGPGLVGGLLIAAAWLVVGGFTFDRWLNSLGSDSWLVVVAPIVVGAGGTLWGGDAVVGRRVVRLATVTAALSIYLYGVLVVAVYGATGHDPSGGMTPAQIVDDNLGDQAVYYLLALPLMTATLGWATAAATARLRGARPSAAPPALATPGSGPSPAGPPRLSTPEADPVPADPRPRAGAPGAVPGRHRMWYLLVLCAALAASAFLVALALLSSR